MSYIEFFGLAVRWVGIWTAKARCGFLRLKLPHVRAPLQRTVRCTSWHRSGTLLAVASFDGTTTVWSVKVGVLKVFSLVDTMGSPDHGNKSLVAS